MLYLNQFSKDLIKALHDCWDFAQKPSLCCTLEHQRLKTALVAKATPRMFLEQVSLQRDFLSPSAFPSCKIEINTTNTALET